MGTTSKAKGRMTAVERDYKKSQGKDLFIKGFSITNISEIIGAKYLQHSKKCCIFAPIMYNEICL